MTIKRTANRPITFSGQMAAYDKGNKESSKIIIGNSNVPKQFTNDIVEYVQADPTGNPIIYTNDANVVKEHITAWLTGWNRRKSKIVNGSTAGAQTNYQMMLTVYKSTGTDTATKVYLGTNVRNDFGDVRFTKSDGTSLLNYWIESYTSGVSATIWIEIDSIPVSPGTSKIYIYYDNPLQTTTSNLDATFLASDMTALTKVDPNNRITINSSSKVTFTHLIRNEIIYLYKSIPSTLDYRLDIEYEVTGVFFGAFDDPEVDFAGVSDTLDVLNNTTNSLYVRNYNAPLIPAYRLYMTSILSAIQNVVPHGDNYVGVQSGYITVTRIGTTVTMYVYTDAARTILAGTETGTVSPAIGMTYAIILSSEYDAGLTAFVNGYIQNLQLRKYASPEPTWGASGPEESD